ncbi:MAG TPA: hypothetical protein VLA49_10500 [Anaerolineales bacterium]|nr:hypothetical protein [Anaerolineales bacterium]
MPKIKCEKCGKEVFVVSVLFKPLTCPACGGKFLEIHRRGRIGSDMDLPSNRNIEESSEKILPLNSNEFD